MAARLALAMCPDMPRSSPQSPSPPVLLQYPQQSTPGVQQRTRMSMYHLPYRWQPTLGSTGGAVQVSQGHCSTWQVGGCGVSWVKMTTLARRECSGQLMCGAARWSADGWGLRHGISSGPKDGVLSHVGVDSGSVGHAHVRTGHGLQVAGTRVCGDRWEVGYRYLWKRLPVVTRAQHMQASRTCMHQYY